jgi:hypothetical protein
MGFDNLCGSSLLTFVGSPGGTQIQSINDTQCCPQSIAFSTLGGYAQNTSYVRLSTLSDKYCRVEQNKTGDVATPLASLDVCVCAVKIGSTVQKSHLASFE